MPADSQKKFNVALKNLSLAEGCSPVLHHDGSEREIPRPVDEDEQKGNYSGKKKKHTLKNAVIITASCLILFVSPSVFGKTHDKKIADTMYSCFLSPCVLYQDTGYQGFRPEGVTIMQPVKKLKGGMLTREEKEYNRKISSFRVRVEHAIGSIKRMRIVKDQCRLRANCFVQRIFKTCAALHNFRIKLNPWLYKS
jgi:hypothetical protein